MGSSRPVLQTCQTKIFISVKNLVPGLSGNSKFPAYSRHIFTVQKTDNKLDTFVHTVTLIPGHFYAISRGVTLQNGPPMELICYPDNVAVARLMDLKNIFAGQVIGHDEDNEVNRIKWLDYELETPLQTKHNPGVKINWVIPPPISCCIAVIGLPMVSEKTLSMAWSVN